MCMPPQSKVFSLASGHWAGCPLPYLPLGWEPLHSEQPAQLHTAPLSVQESKESFEIAGM